MKAAKFVINTDHNTGHNHEDAYIRLTSTKLLDAMAETAKVLADDDNLYCSTIYQLVPSTKGTEYRPVARNYEHGGFYPAGSSSWSDDHYLIRRTCSGTEYYELHFNWDR